MIPIAAPVNTFDGAMHYIISQAEFNSFAPNSSNDDNDADDDDICIKR